MKRARTIFGGMISKSSSSIELIDIYFHHLSRWEREKTEEEEEEIYLFCFSMSKIPSMADRCFSKRRIALVKAKAFARRSIEIDWSSTTGWFDNCFNNFVRSVSYKSARSTTRDDDGLSRSFVVVPLSAISMRWLIFSRSLIDRSRRNTTGGRWGSNWACRIAVLKRRNDLSFSFPDKSIYFNSSLPRRRSSSIDSISSLSDHQTISIRFKSTGTII